MWENVSSIPLQLQIPIGKTTHSLTRCARRHTLTYPTLHSVHLPE